MTDRFQQRVARVQAQIAALEPKVHALLDQTVIEPTGAGPLAGLIATIKDVLVTRGVPTTAGSTMLKGWRPPYDATVVQRLKRAGATIVGKTNCDAWAHGSSTENSDYGPTHNPWNIDHVPGGSSGGSAAAVAAGYGDFSLGTDTGGSIRQPAAFCGVTGLKPTYGRVSRSGLIAMGSSLDTVGPLARDAAMCARVLAVIAGRDRLDATTVSGRPFSADRVTQPVDDSQPLASLRIGVPKEYFADGLESEVAAAVRAGISQLQALGATILDVSLPSSPHALAAYYIISPAEVSSNLARFDGLRFGYSVIRGQADHANLQHVDLVARNRAEGFGAEAKRRIILGTFVLSAGYVDAYYKRALRVRTLLRQEFQQVFESVDLLVTPTTPNPAFKFGAKTADPLTMYLEDIYTVSANLVGIPGVSLPCGLTKLGLPIGLQLLGPWFGEEQLLRTAHIYQQATDWHRRQPALAERGDNHG